MPLVDPVIERVLAEFERRADEEQRRTLAPGAPGTNLDDLLLSVGREAGTLLYLLVTGAQSRRILELAALVVMQRPGWELPELETLQKSLALDVGFPLRLQLIQAPLIDIASRDLRARIAQGRSVRYMIPRAVEAYVAEKGLYR